MKNQLYVGILFVFLFLQGCVTNKQDVNVENQTKLNDIWILKKIEGNSFKKMKKDIVLEFNINNKIFYGTDGCNRISGNFKKLTKDELSFGIIRKTMMACIDMEIPNKYGQLLEKVEFYKIDKLNLYLLDENKRVLLEFLKVD